MPKTKFQEFIFTLITSGCISLSWAFITSLSTPVDFRRLHSVTHCILFRWNGSSDSSAHSSSPAKHPNISRFRVAKPTDRPIFIILCIQTFTVCTMVPLMSLLGTIESSGITSNLIFIWLQTICLNFIIAYPLQILVVGPFCRFVFRHLFVSASQENEGKIEHEMEQQGFAE